MSLPSVDAILLCRIIAFCRKIEALRDRFGGWEVFQCDTAYQDAIALNILQIGEAAGRLSEGFRSAHSEIPWRAIRSMRNQIAHAFASIDITLVWNTAERYIPQLRQSCETLLTDFA